MKKCLNIIASIDKPELVDYITESLASNVGDTGYGEIEVPSGWEAIKTSSVENFVAGNVEMIVNGGPGLRAKYKTRFLFGCTKEKDDMYRLDWSMSLS